MSSIPATFREQVAVRQVSELTFESVCNPGKMGNLADIAYGGCTIGTGINAAYQTVPAGFHAYSIMGHYLGPAFTDRGFEIKIRIMRETRSFRTRGVEILQKHGKEKRSCCYFSIDFHRDEPLSLLTYSAQPSSAWPNFDDCVPLESRMDDLINEGQMTSEAKQLRQILFGMMEAFFEGRTSVAQSVAAQNVYGMLSDLETSQDHLAITEKVSGDWARCKHLLETQGEHIAALAFFMDGALSFLPLTHDHKSLVDAQSCSSLDFALRIMSNDFNFNEWHLREMKTINGAAGRTYTEGRLWNSSGSMVASMTQQSILRPHNDAPTKAAI